MIIGNFRIEDGSYRGDITTLSLHRANVVLRPTIKTGEREPDYRIVQDTETGTVDLGAASQAAVALQLACITARRGVMLDRSRPEPQDSPNLGPLRAPV